LGVPGDILFAISTSGNSENVIRATKAAKQIGLVTVGFLGCGGGELAGLVDHALIVPSDDTQRIQEGHITMGHIIIAKMEQIQGLGSAGDHLPMSEPPSIPPLSEKNIPRPDRIFKNSVWMLIGQAGSAFLSFIAIFAMTRYLGPEKFGLYSTALSLALMLIPLSDLGFDLYMVRAISADMSGLSKELSRTLSIKAILSVVVWVLMVLAAIMLRYNIILIGYVAMIGISLVIASLAQALSGQSGPYARCAWNRILFWRVGHRLHLEY